MGPEHNNILVGEHTEKFKNIENNIDVLFKKDEANVKHREESVKVRAMVETHEKQFENLSKFRREFRVWAAGLIISIFGSLIFFGGKLNVLERLEKLHPIQPEKAFANEMSTRK